MPRRPHEMDVPDPLVGPGSRDVQACKAIFRERKGGREKGGKEWSLSRLYVAT